MQIIFRINDSDEMEKAVTGLIELLKTKGGFHGVRTDGGLMIKGKRGWKKVRPVEPWSSPTNNLLWQAMLDKLYMEHYVFRWWAHGGMYSLYYNKPDRYWSLSYEGDQFSMHKVQNNGVIGAHILNIMLTLGGEPHLHIPESPGLAWTDVDGTKAGQRIREQQLAQQSADRQRQQAAAEQQLREQLQAQQNPLLVRLTEELIEAGKSLKEAFAQAKGQLNWAENEARQLAQQAAARERKVLAGMQQLAGQLAAQQNPLLAGLTEDLLREGHKPQSAFDQARGQLNQAEKEARHLEKMAADQAVAQKRRADREAPAALQWFADQLEAQQNPVLVRLAQDLLERGKTPKEALAWAGAQLDSAEEKAQHLEGMAAEHAAIQQRRAEKFKDGTWLQRYIAQHPEDPNLPYLTT